MASLTQKTEKIRKRKVRKQGKKRKLRLAAGTTPKFPIHIKDDKECILPQSPGQSSD